MSSISLGVRQFHPFNVSEKMKICFRALPCTRMSDESFYQSDDLPLSHSISSLRLGSVLGRITVQYLLGVCLFVFLHTHLNAVWYVYFRWLKYIVKYATFIFRLLIPFYCEQKYAILKLAHTHNALSECEQIVGVNSICGSKVFTSSQSGHGFLVNLTIETTLNPRLK